MRLVFASLAAAAALGTMALAQTSGTPSGSSPTMQPMPNTGSNVGSPGLNPSNQAGQGNAAVTIKPADSPQTTGSVEPGANSFTEGQVRSRLESQGFSNVSELRKDEQGIWRGQAMRDGRQTNVAVDYRGTIQAQ